MVSLVTSFLALTALQGQEMRLLRFPTVSGDKVAFCYGSDLWVADRSGGFARRLTTHSGDEVRPKFSPDGKWIAFTGQYDGTNELYVVSSEGGEPRRLTYMPGNKYALSWTPDGKVVFSTVYGNAVPFTPMLYTIAPEGGTPQPGPIGEINQGTYSPDGKRIAFGRRQSNLYNWRRYRGGVQGQVSVYDFDSGQYSELPSGRENSWFPMWVGDAIYYISDRNQGTVNLYRYDLKTKRDTQLTKYADGDIKWPNTDGKSIVWERDGYLYLWDIASGKEERVSPRVRSDMVAARPRLQRLGSQVENGDLSPTGTRVVLESHGDIFSVPAKSGDTRNMTASPGVRDRMPTWSPDGKSIAYVSDRSGEKQVYLEPQMGGQPVALTTVPSLNPVGLAWSPDSKKIAIPTRDYKLYTVDMESKKLTLVVDNRFGGGIPFDWSPDSGWIAFADLAANQNGRIRIYEVASGKTTTVTDGYYFDTGVAFDQSGKYLFFTSNRTFAPSFGLFEFSLKVEDAERVYVLPLTKDLTNPLIPDSDEEPEAKPAGGPPGDKGGPSGPKPVKIDFEGLAERAIPLPMDSGSYTLVAGTNEGVLYLDGEGLSKFDLKSRDSQAILRMGGIQGISFNPSRTKMLYLARGGVFVVDVRPGLQPGQGAVSTSAVEATVDPRAEWKQMFWETWRYERDFFYDPAMVGVDWKAVGDKYEKLLPYVSDISDMGYILGMVIGELGTGHAYVQGFGGPPPNPVNQGLLGADYEVAGNAVRFRRILKGANYEESKRGPLSEPGIDVKQGEYLLEIDGLPVNDRNSPNSRLLGKAGRAVTLTVNSTPSTTGARKVRVVATADEGGLRYSDWVEGNRAKVDQLSGGRIGYMHIPNTSFQGAIELIRGFYSQWNKDALLIDERFNGGGFIQPWFVDTLIRDIKAGIRSRYGDDTFDARANEGPKALLINEYAGSGGDFFPWMFKHAKAGPLIGKRTWGGLVGIRGGIPLMGGGSVTAPEFGIYDREIGKWIAENNGVEPDIEIDNDPASLAKGRDPQLERGVEYLLNELKKARPQPKRPDYPKTTPPPGR